MTNWNDADLIKIWEVLRKNKYRFAFQYGSLMLGMPYLVFSLLVEYTFWDDTPITLRRLVIGAIIFIVVGYIMGLRTYNKKEKRYKELMSQDTQ